MNCGFTDVVATGGKYQCAKCSKVMPPEWVHDVLAAGLKLPKEQK